MANFSNGAQCQENKCQPAHTDKKTVKELTLSLPCYASLTPVHFFSRIQKTLLIQEEIKELSLIWQKLWILQGHYLP